METMTKYALAYTAEKGIRQPWSIFPLMRNGKKPATANGVKDATRDRDQVNRWWTANPFFNIGIATGEVNGFIILDIDNHKDDENGAETLADLQRSMGKLPDTVEAVTWSGGRHLFFKYPTGEDIRNATGIAPGIDIRANGGYIVGAGSVINGKSYEW